jgi:hypothetical protein
MADTKISDLSAGTALAGTEVLPSVQSGATVKHTFNQVKTFVGSVLRSIWVPAAAMRPSSSGGCAALALVATSANQPDVSSLDFDATTAEYAQFWVRMPKNWNEGTVTAQFYW